MIRKAALLTLLTVLLVPTGMAGTAVAGSSSRSESALRALPGRQAPPADPLLVEQVAPEVVRDPAAPITIGGTVTGTPNSAVRVRVDYSGQPLRLRSDMDVFLSGQGYFTPRYNTKVQATQLDQSGRLRFEFTITPGELGMSRLGVYPIAVEVVDAATGQRISIERTFLPYVPDGQDVPKVKLAVALPIADRPHRADDATFMDDDLRASVSSGRLAALLKVAQEAGKSVTWFVDPGVLQDVRQTASGPYTVRTGDDDSRKTADATAGQWLAGLRTALTGKPVAALPYADPDLTALVHNGLEEPAVAAIQRGSSLATDLLGEDVQGSTVWPTGGIVDRDAADELAMAGVTSLLLSQDALPPRAPAPGGQGAGGQVVPGGTTPSATPDAAARLETVADSPVTALLADPGLGRILSGDTSVPGAAMLARQRFVAETAMIAFEPAGQTGQTGDGSVPVPARTVIAAPTGHLWNPDPDFVTSLLEAVSAAPWLRMTTLGSVKPSRHPTPRGDLAYTERDHQAELSRSYLAAVRRLDQEAEAASTVTAERTELFHEAILRLSSSAWRGDGKRATAFAKRVEAAVDGRIAGVSVIDSPRAIAGANGQVPVSIANNLDKDVLIKVRVTSENRSRLSIDAPDGVFETGDAIRVLRARSQLVNVPVVVPARGGEARIDIQLLTSDDKPYGDPVHVVVRATGYTGIALVIVGAALAIMLAAVVMRILRRRSRKSFPFSPPVPPDAGRTPVEQEGSTQA
ncbi:DUF6049 family protein [Microbispora sp. ATCC PTA-5024]|uniref:DUF6049 family protein n=1 Tax=Microbispora sp. ATCC PTA-5024 TaxID=316330 RepID=UPI0003DD8DA9|nr:DUF6049 family protein [Microbispora sp. ATCC PTA-5024]ETK35032.1 hypothetical protein MPTA5024_16205 [Microbispora sp. ATCC PTA-5024]